MSDGKSATPKSIDEIAKEAELKSKKRKEAMDVAKDVAGITLVASIAVFFGATAYRVLTAPDADFADAKK